MLHYFNEELLEGISRISDKIIEPAFHRFIAGYIVFVPEVHHQVHRQNKILERLHHLKDGARDRCGNAFEQIGQSQKRAIHLLSKRMIFRQPAEVGWSADRYYILHGSTMK